VKNSDLSGNDAQYKDEHLEIKNQRSDYLNEGYLENNCYKKAVLSQRRPRDAPYMSLP